MKAPMTLNIPEAQKLSVAAPQKENERRRKLVSVLPFSSHFTSGRRFCSIVLVRFYVVSANAALA